MANLEQLPPNEPNFKLVLILFLITIPIVILIGYFVLHRVGTKMPDGQHHTSRLSAPAPYVRAPALG